MKHMIFLATVFVTYALDTNSTYLTKIKMKIYKIIMHIRSFTLISMDSKEENSRIYDVNG